MVGIFFIGIVGGRIIYEFSTSSQNINPGYNEVNEVLETYLNTLKKDTDTLVEKKAYFTYSIEEFNNAKNINTKYSKYKKILFEGEAYITYCKIRMIHTIEFLNYLENNEEKLKKQGWTESEIVTLKNNLISNIEEGKLSVTYTKQIIETATETIEKEKQIEDAEKRKTEQIFSIISNILKNII